MSGERGKGRGGEAEGGEVGSGKWREREKEVGGGKGRRKTTARENYFLKN